jgi:hypothetical protein
VTDHPGNHGQLWCRIYHRRRGFAQCIQSIKRFAGPTGLEEYLGAGLAVALEPGVSARALTFTGREYAWYILGRRWRLPRWLSPGVLRVEHRELSNDRFQFNLQLEHPRLGELIYQSMEFRETVQEAQ